eukprot:5252375-Prymnesium_polylepis.1
MKPEVHELDKRVDAHASLLQGYPSTYGIGNACDVWQFTCKAADFAKGVHARLSEIYTQPVCCTDS